MLLGFSVRFTWVSLILHLSCIIALAFIKFGVVPNLDDTPKDISIVFDVVSDVRNIKTQTTKVATAVVLKAQPKQAEKKKKPVINKEATKVTVPAKKEMQKMKSDVANTKVLKEKTPKSPALISKQSEEKYEDPFSLGEISEDTAESIKAIEYIKGKIEEHRNFVGLCGKGLDEVEMVFEIGINSDGSISFAEYLGDNAGRSITESTRQALIRQNLRAIQLAAPFDKLDLTKHKNWQNLRLRFTQN